MTIDTRNFREHPTKGLLLRGAASHYEDRSTGAFTHRRYEGEMAGFIPMAGERVVLALHGWVVTTPRENDTSVPFYMLPSLGGANTLRSFTDYRFHDRNMLLANAELRIAMMTHVDLAMFTDAGNVAARIRRSQSRQAVLRRRVALPHAGGRPSRASTSRRAAKAGDSCSA